MRESDRVAESARRRVVYHGRVQGVGFRATVHGIAARFAVTGYVRNLPDRTVELVADGDEEEIDAFLESVRERFARQVTKSEVRSVERGEAFVEFSIRR